MIIYLDESKKLWKWQFIFCWFLSEHNSNYITNFVELEEKRLWIKNNFELKSTWIDWRLFIDKLPKIEYYKKLKIKTFWFYYTNYYVDSFENSKNNKCLQLADLIVWKYKEFYLFDDTNILDDFVNINKIKDFRKNNYTKI